MVDKYNLYGENDGLLDTEGLDIPRLLGLIEGELGIKLEDTNVDCDDSLTNIIDRLIELNKLELPYGTQYKPKYRLKSHRYTHGRFSTSIAYNRKGS